MCNFRIGQEVVCIDDRNLDIAGEPCPLSANQIYTIQAMQVEMCCGLVSVGVGIQNPNDYDGTVICSCGSCRPDTDVQWMFNNARFAPLQTDSEEADMAEALEEVFSQPLFQ